MKAPRCLLTLLILFLGSSLLHAQFPSASPGVIYSSSGGAGGGELLTINSTTGAASFVGTVASQSVIATAISPTGDLYATGFSGGSAWSLFRIDPTNGNSVVQGPMPVLAGGFADAFHGLEFDIAGNLYGVSRQTGTIVELNPATGALISTVTVTNIDFTGMAREPGTNNIYMSTVDGFLFIFDPGTGQVNFSDSTGVNFVSDLTFDLGGNLYLVQGPAAVPNQLYSVNLTTGAATPIGNLGTGTASATIFNTFSLPQPIVPTLSQWGLILLGLLVLCAGTIAVWRKRSSPQHV